MRPASAVFSRPARDEGPDPPSALRARDIPPTDPAGRKRSPGATAWNVVLGADLGLFAVGVAFALLLYAFPDMLGQQPESEPTRDLAYVNSTVVLVMAGLIPLGWVNGTRLVSWAGTVRYLGLHEPLKRLALGAAWGLGLLGMVIVLAAAIGFADESFGTNSTENPELEALLELMSWRLAFWIAFCAAVAEEILFRGILQKWIGLWGQAVVFGLSHASYGTPLQIIVPFGIGLLFGWMVKRGQGILVPMAAHFVYDFTVASSPLWAEGGL